jgi:hypothetical protein
MAKCGVLFEVRTEFLNTIYMSFGFKGLKICHSKICFGPTLTGRTFASTSDVRTSAIL